MPELTFVINGDRRGVIDPAGIPGPVGIAPGRADQLEEFPCAVVDPDYFALGGIVENVNPARCIDGDCLRRQQISRDCSKRSAFHVNLNNLICANTKQLSIRPKGNLPSLRKWNFLDEFCRNRGDALFPRTILRRSGHVRVPNLDALANERINRYFIAKHLQRHNSINAATTGVEVHCSEVIAHAHAGFASDAGVCPLRHHAQADRPRFDLAAEIDISIDVARRGIVGTQARFHRTVLPALLLIRGDLFPMLVRSRVNFAGCGSVPRFNFRQAAVNFFDRKPTNFLRLIPAHRIDSRILLGQRLGSLRIPDSRLINLPGANADLRLGSDALKSASKDFHPVHRACPSHFACRRLSLC